MTTPPVPPATDLVGLLPPDVDLSSGVGLRQDAPATEVTRAWYGVVWGRLGRGDLAWRWFDLVGAPQLGPWVAAERGRLLRELGGHAPAEELERAAVPAAHDPIDAAMLWVSLAADAVGTASAEVARERLATAQGLLADQPSSPRRDRQTLRAGWVEVEIALLVGSSPPTRLLPSWGPSGALALPAPYRSGSRFHTAKGCLFAGVARRDLRFLDHALGFAPPALEWAVHLARASVGAHGDPPMTAPMTSAMTAAAIAAGTAARARVVPPPGHR